MLGTGGVRRDIWQVDVRRRHAGELDLRFFSRFLQTRKGHFVVVEVDAVGFFEFTDHPFDDALVKIVAAKAVVAGGGENFKHAVADVENGDVERAAAEVVDHDLLFLLFFNAVRQRRGGRLVDDAEHFQARDAAGVLRRLALRIGEIRRHSDDRLRHGRADISLSVGLELLQDHCGDFLRGEFFAVDGHAVVRAHLALNGHDGAVRVGDGLALCDLANHALTAFRERDDRRCCARAFRVCDNGSLAAFENGNTGVGST